MNKFVIAVSTAIFLLGSSFVMASGNKESSLPPYIDFVCKESILMFLTLEA